MHRAALPGVDPEPLIGLSSMWRLRWGTLVVEIAALPVAHYLLDIDLPVAVLSVVMAVTALSNLLLASFLTPERATSGKLASVLLLDVATHTALLFWSGGPQNPFSAFFVVHVAIAALLLGPRWAATLVLVTALCFAALFFIPAEQLGPHAHHVASPLHLQGMWAAYVLSACFVAYFVSKAASALRKREQQLAELGRFAASVERLASLTTMAAGAAHELGTPLSSIAVSATELSNALSASGAPEDLVAEAQHVRREVSRCRAILDRLTVGAGEPVGEAPAPTTFGELVEALASELSPSQRARVDFQRSGGPQVFVSSARGLTLALGNLIRNGLEAYPASDAGARVEVSMENAGDDIRFQVRDRGVGMTPRVAEHVGEPFFTTKPPGTGMGLGAYLVRSFARQVGGELRYHPAEGGGTLAILTLPAQPGAREHRS